MCREGVAHLARLLAEDALGDFKRSNGFEGIDLPDALCRCREMVLGCRCTAGGKPWSRAMKDPMPQSRYAMKKVD